MTTTADLPSASNLPAVAPDEDTDTKTKNDNAILNFIDWVNDNKQSVFFDKKMWPLFFERMKSALLTTCPEKKQEIEDLISSMLQNLATDIKTWSPGQLVEDIITVLVGDSKHFYQERIQQHWNSIKGTAPIAAVIGAFVQENQSGNHRYSRNNLLSGIRYSFSGTGSDAGKNLLIRELMSRLGFSYVVSTEKPHFLIDIAFPAPDGEAALSTSDQNGVPVLLLPAGTPASTKHDKAWLLGVLRAINQFLGIPELHDKDPANHAGGMASSDRGHEGTFTLPEFQGLLDGSFVLPVHESDQYIAWRLIPGKELNAIKSRLFSLATEQGLLVDAEAEFTERMKEINDNINAMLTGEDAADLTLETKRRIAKDARSKAEELAGDYKKITWEIIEPLITQGIIAENGQASGDSGAQEKGRLFALIKAAVAADEVHGRESIDQLIAYPRTLYGEISHIIATIMAHPRGGFFGTSDTWPGRAQADGLIRVYTYRFNNTPCTEGFARSEAGDNFAYIREIIAMTGEQKKLIRSVLAELEGFAAIRFREIEEAGEDADFDFAVYKNDDNKDTGGMLAFAVGDLPYRRVRFSEQTFGGSDASALTIIRHELGHALGLKHIHSLTDDIPSIMTPAVELGNNSNGFVEFQPTDKLTIQLIHGKNPDSGTPQRYFREALKVWLAPGSWAAQIKLNAQNRLEEDYVVTGFMQGKSVLRLFAASDSKSGFHRNIKIDEQDAGTWRIRFTEDAESSKTVLIKGMEPLAFADLQIEILYTDGTSAQLQSDNSAGLKWVQYALQDDSWVAIADIRSPDSGPAVSSHNELYENSSII